MSQKQDKQRQFWDEAARKNAVWYVDTSLDYDRPDMAKFLETGRVVVGLALDEAPATPPGRDLAIEIGCGVGRICLALADRFDRVIGLDISEEMIRRADELVDSEKVSFQLGDGTSLAPIPDGVADLVLSFTVFQHIPDSDVIAGYIEEAGRVLKPGGVFMFQWNNTPGALRWKARRVALVLARRTGRGDPLSRDVPQFLGDRVPLRRIRAALDRGGMDLAGTRWPGQLYASAWAVRRG